VVGEVVGEVEGVALGEAEGAGVESACESEAVEAMTSAKSAIPTLGIMADPMGLTLSSIRRKSLYR
jgi:hypothetical protein